MKVRNLKRMIVGTCMILCATVINIEAAEYDHEVKDKDISFAWKVDGETLAVKLEAKTDGWVGVGFNPVKEMMGGNYILGYVKNGVAEVVDDYGYDENKHKSDTKLDGTTDVTLVGGTEEDGTTIIEFTIPLETADKNDKKIDVNGDTIVLLAYGAGRDSFRSKHRYRNSHKVNLSTGVSEEIK
ncbi:MAG: DOMON domain-containing protein [Desulforhopalus sp.]